MRVHLDLVPRHDRCDQELQANFTSRLKAGPVVYLPLYFLQQLTQCLTVSVAEHLGVSDEKNVKGVGRRLGGLAG